MPLSLEFSKHNLAKIYQGKRTTVRLGLKSHSLGPVAFLCDGKDSGYKASITEIRMVKFGNLGLSDAVADGFNSVEDLRAELQSCYNICVFNSDDVTVVRFNLINSKGSNYGK